MGLLSLLLISSLAESRVSKEPELETFGIGPRDLLVRAVPLSSGAILFALSSTISLDAKAVLGLVSAIMTLNMYLDIRRVYGGLNSGKWDLLVPVLIWPILISQWVAIICLMASSYFYMRCLTLKRGDASAINASLIAQLPSICIGPAVILLLRDQIDLSIAMPRVSIETFGMIANGIGSALWTSIVMRARNILCPTSIVTWLVGLAFGGLYAVGIPNAFLGALVALVTLEMLRGSLWLGLTDLILSSDAWKGFRLNMLFTAIPFVSMLIVRETGAVKWFFVAYGLCHLPAVLILIWQRGVILRQRQRKQGDSPSP